MAFSTAKGNSDIIVQSMYQQWDTHNSETQTLYPTIVW